MSTIKNMTVKAALATTVFGIFIAAGSASAATTITIDLSFMDKIFADMKAKTMGQLYPTMPLKDQMRGKMMIANASNNFMQPTIQPVMMKLNMEPYKRQQMARMVELTR